CVATPGRDAAARGARTVVPCAWCDRETPDPVADPGNGATPLDVVYRRDGGPLDYCRLQICSFSGRRWRSWNGSYYPTARPWRCPRSHGVHRPHGAYANLVALRNRPA